MSVVAVSLKKKQPAWLTVDDALTTNAFPVRAGTGRYRIRAAYGGPVALTLDPHPGALAQTPGATNGPWLCDMRVEPDRANTVVFSDGETPAPVPGGPDSVDGLLLLAPPPAFPVHSLSSPPPRAVLQPLRMTAGTVVLGNGGWYCLCASLPPCDWPDYSMIGCDAVSMSMNGVTGDTPLMTKDEAHDIYWERFPCVECTVTQTVANALYPFLYGKVIFSFRQCEAVGGVSGAEERKRVLEMMELVGLARRLYENYPSQLSGGDLTGVPSPQHRFITTDFWAQGLSFGLDYRF